MFPSQPLRSAVAAVSCAVFLPVAASAQTRPAAPLDTLVVGLAERVRTPAERADPRSAPAPVLEIGTGRSLACLLPLDVRVSRRAARATIDVRGIAPVELCPDALGPATGSAPLPARTGTYRLDIRVGEHVDRYRLRVDERRLSLSPASGAFTRVAVSRYQRAPRYSVAVYCFIPSRGGAGPDTARLAVCERLVGQMRDTLGAREIRFDEADGEIPFPLRNDMRREEIRYLQLQLAGDFARAGELLHRFQAREMEGRTGAMFIELQDWRGTIVTTSERRGERPRCGSAAACAGASPPHPGEAGLARR